MSLKELLCSIWRFFLKLYFGYLRRMNEVSQTHGVNYILDERLHPLERLVWVVIVISAFCGAISIGSNQLGRYNANPTVISLERDYHDWNGTMPAVTFCYVDRLSPEAVEVFLETKWNITPSHKEYPFFSRFIESVSNISVMNLQAFDEFAFDEQLRSADFLEITKAAFDEFAFDEQLRSADFLEITKAVVPIFEQYISNFDRTAQLDAVPIVTEKGLCYSVNSPLTPIFSVANRKPHQENEIPVREPLSCKYTKNQCFLKIDVYGFRLSSVFVHSPFEIPLGDTQAPSLEPTDEITATYRIIETTADDSVRELSVSQRNCLFYDEKIRRLPSYSLNLCTMECRARAALNACGCKPFFYPFVQGPDCNVEGIFCLNRLSWPERTKGTCDCPKPCLDLLYIPNSYKVESWDVGEEGIPFAQKSTFRLEILPAKMRNRREVLFTFEDLLVSLGAATSLFIGISFYNMLHGLLLHFELVIEIIQWCRGRRS
uniref:Putative sodium channel protein nach rhagoletis zephyria n=1 Tax=Lutzomyia longipalpis TaxID=7200 RepID=A0A1B0FV54_LUTLO